MDKEKNIMGEYKIYVIKYKVTKTENKYEYTSVAKDPDGAICDLMKNKSFKKVIKKIKIVKILQFNDMESFESYFHKRVKEIINERRH
jgi:hypothetical protein